MACLVQQTNKNNFARIVLKTDTHGVSFLAYKHVFELSPFSIHIVTVHWELYSVDLHTVNTLYWSMMLEVFGSLTNELREVGEAYQLFIKKYRDKWRENSIGTNHSTKGTKEKSLTKSQWKKSPKRVKIDRYPLICLIHNLFSMAKEYIYKLNHIDVEMSCTYA